MTTVKCNKHKCCYNIEGICSKNKINLKYFKCFSYNKDNKCSFKVQDLIIEDIKIILVKYINERDIIYGLYLFFYWW